MGVGHLLKMHTMTRTKVVLNKTVPMNFRVLVQSRRAILWDKLSNFRIHIRNSHLMWLSWNRLILSKQRWVSRNKTISLQFLMSPIVTSLTHHNSCNSHSLANWGLNNHMLKMHSWSNRGLTRRTVPKVPPISWATIAKRRSGRLSKSTQVLKLAPVWRRMRNTKLVLLVTILESIP
jgi:hypothetical protein